MAPLHNRYFLVRAGETAWETDGETLITHPVRKLHVDKCGLSHDGYMHARAAAESLADLGYGTNTEAWVWTSIHAASTQTAEIISSEHMVPRHHIVPEFSFLDQRGYGSLEGSAVVPAREFVRKQDALNADFRMPPNEDGTPNESLRDVQVRVRQALQIMETQYSDLDIAVVSTDSDTLSTLHCSLEGHPLVAAHQMAFQPGEVRLLDYRTRVEDPRAQLSGECDDLDLSSVTHGVLRLNNVLFKNGPESLIYPKP
mmetsp:Transcript_12359/g.24595  ORF Transcript_12359/g.24595 Transcript_12359/m.24595 type:complete len:256 (+) Transcript_12359:2-769(+)